ncbi:MAG: hypothetical protein JNM93_13140 [Bacteriovoracaceae bacterium]|nr:hypothetical protein [Bacteriovoracaceae bacterium]
MKKPIFAIGLLMFVVFLLNVYRTGEGKSLFFREDWVPSSCKAVLVMLEKRIPANWEVSCESNNLAIEMHYTEPAADYKDLKSVLYKRLANDMVFIARNSPEDSLSRVYLIRIQTYSPGMDISAMTEGQFISKLKTIKSPSNIVEHLKTTVQVKERIK